MEFARFLGLPVPARANMTDITEAVCEVPIDTSATSSCRRDAQRQLATRVGDDVSGHIKYLSENYLELGF